MYSNVWCTQGCSIDKKVWSSPAYDAIAYKLCKDNYYTKSDVLEKTFNKI